MQVLTSVIVLCIVFAVYILTDIKDYKERKVNSIINLTQVVGQNTIPTITFQDNDAAESILKELMKVSPEIVYAGVSNKWNEPFASYTKKGKDSMLIAAHSTKNKTTEFRENHLFVKRQIFDNNELAGYIGIEVELTELEAIKESKYKIAAILLLVSIGFSALIGIAIQPYISKRLLLLVNRMKEVSRTGDYSRPVADHGNDEISTLFKVFNDLMQQIKQNEKKKDEFIGVASHELKTPLTSIKGYLDLLSSLEEKQPNVQFIQKARTNVNKLEQLVKDLLDVSKIQSGQLQLNMKAFNMDELIDETIASFNMIGTTHSVRKQSSCNEMILADRQRIEQVLVNLLSNAIKYSPGEEKVFIFCKREDSSLIVRIRDFGIGIPKEEQVNIFKRFYRTQDSSIHISGFGLGLYICNDILTRHKGKIWIESEDKGSSFYFSLPVKNIDIANN